MSQLQGIEGAKEPLQRLLVEITQKSDDSREKQWRIQMLGKHQWYKNIFV
jgi:hypothetical protein